MDSDITLYSNIEILGILVAAGTDLNRTDDGFTALMLATWIEDIEMVKFFIEVGVDLEVRDNDGRTALIIAAEIGSTVVVELLIKAGANIEARNNRGDTSY